MKTVLALISDFHSMKQLEVFRTTAPPGWESITGYFLALNSLFRLPIYTVDSWVERGTVGVKCLVQERNTMSLVRASPWPLNTKSSTSACMLDYQKKSAKIYYG